MIGCIPTDVIPTLRNHLRHNIIESKIGKSLAMSHRRTSELSSSSSSVNNQGSKNGEEKGGNDIVKDDNEGQCSPLDRECLRGTLVFPCASECRSNGALHRLGMTSQFCRRG